MLGHPRLTALLATLLATVAFGAQAAPAHPPLSGMWLLSKGQYYGESAATERQIMPLTPAGARVQRGGYVAEEVNGQVLSDNGKRCLPVGMPDLMANEFALEALDTGDRVTFLSENSTLPRTIYMAEKAHPKDREPSWNGHSIGHWEGKVLVVDTVGFNDRELPISFSGGVHSSTTHLVEHIRLEDGGKRMIDDMTFDDPRYLTKPWTKRHVYDRLPRTAELWEYVCEPDTAGWSERYHGDAAAAVAPRTEGVPTR